MTPRDILYEISSGELTAEEDIEAVIDSVMDSPYADSVESLLLLSREEWTAYCHGATFLELADWRYHGWPIKCVICGNNIEIQKFGWKVIDVNNVSVLKHIQCP